MKILKPGREQKGWSKECRCSGFGNGAGGCGAKLLVEEGDLFQTSRSDYGGDTDYFVTFRCSACGVLTDIQGTPFNAPSLPTKAEWLKAHAPTAWDRLNED